MSTAGTARLRVAVVFLCIAAGMALVSFSSSIFAINGAFVDSPLASPIQRPTSTSRLALIMAIAGAVSAMVGLIVIHRARRTGWPAVLLAGTVLTAVQVLPLIDFPEPGSYENGVIFAAIGAGAVLTILGLLGAANWLIHAGYPGSGCLIAGLALVAPTLGRVLLRLLPIVEQADLDLLLTLGLVLCGTGIAGAVGATVLIPVLRKQSEPEQVPVLVTVVGGIAAAIQIVPAFVIWNFGSPHSPENLDPTDPNALETLYDDLSLQLGLTGLAIFVVGMGLAAVLGSASLGAVIAVGLVLYAVPIPLSVAMSSVDSRAGVAVLTVLGVVLAGFAAASWWRAWLAGGAGAVVGIVLVAMRPSFMGGRVSTLLAACLLLLIIIAAVTTVAAGAAAVADRIRVPAVLGTVAVLIQVGLVYTGSLLWHSRFTRDPREPGFEPPTLDWLTIASGVALLVGALLVVVLPLIRTPAPAPEVPDAAPPDQAVPVAR